MTMAAARVAIGAKTFPKYAPKSFSIWGAQIKSMNRGKWYERRVQAHFEGLGFKYVLNVKNGFEIDGIAVSDATAYVIEAKCWASRPMIGASAHFCYLARKIRGAIDGKQERASLPHKVAWCARTGRSSGSGRMWP